MKQAILISIVVGGVAGAGSAFLASNLCVPCADKTGLEGTDALSPGLAGSELPDQLAALTRENAKLAERITHLEARQLQATTNVIERAPALANPEVPAGLEERLAALESALTTSTGAVAKNLPAAIDDRLAAIKAEEERQEEQERAERRLERTDERIVEMTRELGLDANQAISMRGILLDQEAKRDQMMSEMREGRGNFGDNPREAFMAVRQEFDARVAQVLTPDQFTKYQEQNPSFGRRGFEFGAGRGDRDGGDRGGARPAPVQTEN